MKTYKSLSAAIALTLAAAAAIAGTPAEPKVDSQIRQELTKTFPNVKITAIEKSPIAGVYSVFTEQEVVYASASGNFILSGTLIETASGKNMSQELFDLNRSIDFSDLPLDAAIKIVKGTGERVVAVFSDPDCPFCEKLERELATVTDTTVYVFLLPIASLHPQAPEKAKNIWCSPQREQAWARWMLEKQVPAAAATDCAVTALEQVYKVADKLKVSSTPTLFFPNGRRVSGSPPASSLVTLFKENAKPAKAAAKTASNAGTP
jgi:thiol:disulfide interchange protein DsbC